jgi:hypothetical protein
LSPAFGMHDPAAWSDYTRGFSAGCISANWLYVAKMPSGVDISAVRALILI